jgi:hypothetical protein
LRNMLRQEPHEGHPKQRGSIVNIASQLGLVARPGAGEFLSKTLTALRFLTVARSCILRIEGRHCQHDAGQRY